VQDYFSAGKVHEEVVAVLRDSNVHFPQISQERSMRLFLAVVMACVLVPCFSGTVSARSLSCLLPLAAIETRIREIMPAGALEIERHTGPGIQPVLDRINGEPPETDFATDSVLIAYWHGQPGALVILGLDGCVAGQVTLPAARARALFGESL
jgi:hypothetical protein